MIGTTSSIVNPIFVTSVNDALLDDTCGMRYWFARFHGGSGLTPRKNLLRDEMLIATQADLRTISELDDLSREAINALIADILGKLTDHDRKDTRAMELLYRRLGWMAAFAIFLEPQIRRLYLTIPCDEVIGLERRPLIVNTTPGRVLRSRATNELEVREYVPTSHINAKWRAGWEWHIRPHVNLLAVRESLQRRITWSRMGGMATGFVSAADDRLRHPYVYAFYNKATGEWTHNFKSSIEADWIERPIWEFPYSLTDWVIKCGAQVAENQFPLSPLIPLNGPMVDAWVERRTFIERQRRPIRQGAQSQKFLRVMYFSQNTQQCAPQHEAPCDYKELCWNEPFLSTALAQTQFTPNITESPLVIKAPATLSERLEQAIKEGELVDDTDPMRGDQTPFPDDSSDTLPVIDLSSNSTAPVSNALT